MAIGNSIGDIFIVDVKKNNKVHKVSYHKKMIRSLAFT